MASKFSDGAYICKTKKFVSHILAPLRAAPTGDFDATNRVRSTVADVSAEVLLLIQHVRPGDVKGQDHRGRHARTVRRAIPVMTPSALTAPTISSMLRHAGRGDDNPGDTCDSQRDKAEAIAYRQSLNSGKRHH
jgi:hypothetical protein